MNYALIMLFGVLIGAFGTFNLLQWALSKQSGRAPLIRLIHDKYAHEFYDYCDSVYGKKQFILNLTNLTESDLNAQKDSEQSQVSSQEGSQESSRGGRPG